jgi:hypothetical protein
MRIKLISRESEIGDGMGDICSLMLIVVVQIKFIDEREVWK